MKPITRGVFKVPDGQIKIWPNDHNSPNKTDSQSQLLRSMADSLQKLLQISTVNKQDPRDQAIRIPPIQLTNNCLNRNKQIQEWITTLVKKVLSEAFKKFLNGELSEKQTKVYCSQHILTNIILLTKSHSQNKYSEEDFRVIDEALTKSLKYLSLKYPLAEGNTVINKKLQKAIAKTNAIDSNTNNLILSSGVTFQFSSSGNYNDSIMKFLNYIYELVDQKDKNDKSLYERFENYFQDLFTKVQDKNWVDSANKFSTNPIELKRQVQELKRQNQKDFTQNEDIRTDLEEYRQKVKLYTSFSINRKLSKDIQQFTSTQIQSGNIDIKNPAILRILTKWCEELEVKYTDQDYFLNKAEDTPQRDGGQTFIAKLGKLKIAEMITEQKEKVELFMKKLRENMYQNQSQCSYNRLKEDQFYHIDQEEKVLGKFTGKNLKKLETYLVLYLNRLIHGLAKVCQQNYNQYLKIKSNWVSPPQFITFLIGDLLRCKFSSGQKQVLRVYKEMEMMSTLYPEKLKIIRVKNRLNKGTKDILINIKFQDSILCEVQLAVKQSINHFLSHSDKFSHYVYELTRTMFGPISQMCNIWFSLDDRSNQITKILDLIEKKTLKVKILHEKQHECNQQNFLPEQLPFICSQCKIDIYKNCFIFNNFRCSDCMKYVICGKCRLKKINSADLKKQIFKDRPQLNINQISLLTSKKVPEYGIFVPINSKVIRIQYFKSFKFDKKIYLMGLKNKQPNLLYQLSQKQLENNEFLDHNIVFQASTIPELENITKQTLQKDFIVRDYLTQCYLKQKQALSMEQMDVSIQDILKVKNQNAEAKITSLFLRGNKISEIESLTNKFPNVKFATLNHNKIRNLKGVGKLKNLQKLRLIINEIKQIPDQISNCIYLESLSLQKNKLEHITDKIGELSNLKQFWISNNSLLALPQSVCQLKNLQVLNFPSNKITIIPDNIGNLKKLRIIRIQNNTIESLPESFPKLRNLQIIYAQKNKISTLPENIGDLQKIITFSMNSNKIKSLPESLFKAITLEKLQFNYNKINEIPEAINNLENLQHLCLEGNSITTIPPINNLQKLVALNLSSNKIQLISQSIGKLSKLRILLLGYNKIIKLPKTFANLKALLRVQILNNKLTQFPQEFLHLPHLKILLLQNNQISVIPEDIWQLKELQIFHFQSNLIEHIPDGIRGLEHLSDLGVGNQNIKYLSPVIYQLPKIKNLQISMMLLEQLPQQIYLMHFLISLDIHGNKLSELHPNIGQLINLRTINASSNKILRIPASIKNIKSLVELNIRNNQVSEFPQEFWEIKTLKILNISHNKIQFVPKSLSQLKNLTPNFLYLFGNPIKKIECLEFILKKTSDKSRKFILQLQHMEKNEQTEQQNNEQSGEQMDCEKGKQ